MIKIILEKLGYVKKDSYFEELEKEHLALLIDQVSFKWAMKGDIYHSHVKMNSYSRILYLRATEKLRALGVK